MWMDVQCKAYPDVPADKSRHRIGAISARLNTTTGQPAAGKQLLTGTRGHVSSSRSRMDKSGNHPSTP